VPRNDHPIVLTPLPGEDELGLVDGLAQLSFAVQGALGRIAATYDVSVVQARLLGILRDRRPTIKELAGLLQLDKSSVTGLVDRAEERGFVRRNPSLIDGRSVQVSITSTGRHLIDEATAAFESEIGGLVADLTPAQRSELSKTATAIVAAHARRCGIDIFDIDPAAAEAGRTGRWSPMGLVALRAGVDRSGTQRHSGS
jgi:MarR family transcriptional regulator, lower aerobic nicotinate degradation pathway regulator